VRSYVRVRSGFDPRRIEDAQRILGEHIALGSRRIPEATINMLLFLLDRRDVGRRQTLRAGYGLRVVK
jgi:hypothetical protein